MNDRPKVIPSMPQDQAQRPNNHPHEHIGGRIFGMLVSPLLALAMLLVTAEADKIGLLAVDAGGELLLAYHVVPPAPSTTSEHQHQAFI